MARHGADVDRTEEWAELRARYLGDAGRAARVVGPGRAPPGAAVEQTSSRRSTSTRACSSSRSPSCSRTATTRARRTSSSTSATATSSRSSTSPASTSATTPRCSAVCTTSRSRSSPTAGSTSGPSSTPRACPPRGGWVVALLQRPRRRAARAHLRPAAGDVRHDRRVAGGRSAPRTRELCSKRAVPGASSSHFAGPGRRGCRRRGRAAGRPGLLTTLRRYAAAMAPRVVIHTPS